LTPCGSIFTTKGRPSCGRDLYMRIGFVNFFLGFVTSFRRLIN